MDPTTLEKIKKIALIALFSDDDLMNRLVLKGGSALDLVYQYPSGRSSIDIDLSMAGDFDEKEIQPVAARIETLLFSTFGERGYRILDFKFSPKPARRPAALPDFWGGYLIEFKVVTKANFERFQGQGRRLKMAAEVVGPHQVRTFKVDISKYECCDAKVEHELDDYVIFVYSPELIVAEKLRAICQKLPEYEWTKHNDRKPNGRARDFYDIHLVVGNEPDIDWNSGTFRSLLACVFEAKRVDLSFLSRLGDSDVRSHHAADFELVRTTVPPRHAKSLKNFDFYFDFIASFVKKLQPLGKIQSPLD